MARTLRQERAQSLALDIQEYTAENPECNSMTVEDFIYYLLDFNKEIDDEQTDT